MSPEVNTCIRPRIFRCIEIGHNITLPHKKWPLWLFREKNILYKIDFLSSQMYEYNISVPAGQPDPAGVPDPGPGHRQALLLLQLRSQGKQYKCTLDFLT